MCLDLLEEVQRIPSATIEIDAEMGLMVTLPKGVVGVAPSLPRNVGLQYLQAELNEYVLKEDF